ncbi:MAG: hypothetical protein R6U41_05670 [Desulfosalsimonas sp.]|uniref:hypothetical protein n=1 Tax=Desulfosalsimonas sp. TaxID=3073848 RepID=UPI003970464F
MNLKISTKRHCIETEVKRQYNKAVSKYFKASGKNEKKDLENRIDLLHHAIETLDFSSLRSRYPDLRGDSSAEIGLFRDDAGAIGITINGEEIETTNPN